MTSGDRFPSIPKFTLTLGLILGALGFVSTMVGPGSAPVRAQNRMSFSIASPQGGHIALGLALRKLSVSATYANSVAHPDDENNALFAQLGYGQGLRVVSVQNNRGDGGENQVGTELSYDIAVLRTQEAQAVRRVDGAEQFYARGIDFGYKWDTDYTIEKWGHKDIVGDYVRLWRTIRPDVILTMNMIASGGNRAHEATAVLARESFKAAGDPNMYPEQIREGLRPWQPKKLYYSGAIPGTPAGSVPLTPANTGAYDPLLNRTYAEIGSDASSYHKSQSGAGRGGGFPTPPPAAGGARGGRQGGRGAAGAPAAAGAGGPGGPGGGRGFQLVESVVPNTLGKQETSIFDSIDTSLWSIAGYAGPNPPLALTQGLGTLLDYARQAQMAFDAGNDAGTAAPLEAGLTAARALQAKLGTMGLGDSALYEVDFRIKQKVRNWEDAVLAAHYVTFDALANDGLIIPGQPIQLVASVTNRGATDVSISSVQIDGFDSAAACAPGDAKRDATYQCFSTARVPADAKLTRPYFHDDFWPNPASQAQMKYDSGVEFGIPNAPSPFQATFRIKAGSVEIVRDQPFEYRYSKDVFFGDKRMELSVVPEFSAKVSPAMTVIPQPVGAAKTIEREVRVQVTNSSKGAAKALVALEVPQGWKATPATAELSLSREDESLTARFVVSAPVSLKSGSYAVKAVVTSPGTDKKFSEGYQTVEYPHIQRRQIIRAAEATMKVVDVKVAPNLSVGYIEGTGDEVAPSIRNLPVKLNIINDDELAWGDLSKYDVIVTGIRAYQGSAALRAYNARLLEFVNRGGTLVVQYGPLEANGTHSARTRPRWIGVG